MTTGVNPGVHGIFSFVLTDSMGRRVRVHNALDVDYPRIHHVASLNNLNNLKSLIADMPLSS